MITNNKATKVTRKHSPPIKVYCLPAEKQEIEALAEQAGMSAARYLREVGQGYQITGVVDCKQVRELARINGDLGRLGGLLKLWLTQDQRARSFGEDTIRAVNGLKIQPRGNGAANKPTPISRTGLITARAAAALQIQPQKRSNAMADPKNQTNTDATAERPPVSDAAAGREAAREKMADAQTPGYQAEFDSEEAERAGAFVENALSEQDAQESTEDLAELDEQEGKPSFLDDEGPLADIPPFFNTTNIRELYDWKPGESLDEAIARKKAQEG